MKIKCLSLISQQEEYLLLVNLQVSYCKKRNGGKILTISLRVMVKAKAKQIYNGMQLVKSKVDKHQDEASTRTISNVKKNGPCYCYSKRGHHVYECSKNKFDKYSKYKRHDNCNA